MNASTTTKELPPQLKKEPSQVSQNAHVVGTWVWLEFGVPSLQEVRAKLKELGFNWNGARKCWRHPCRIADNDFHDPHRTYPVVQEISFGLNEPKVHSPRNVAKEYKVIALRECPLPDEMHQCDTPDKAVDYWRRHVATCPYFNPECECFVVLLLNTRRRVKGHQLISIGTLDTILVHPREAFRVAVVSSSAAVSDA